MKLKEIYNTSEFNKQLSYSNLDDVFSKVVSLGIKEVVVDINEMFMIANFMAFNVGKDTKESWDAMETGKVDMVYGIKLKLE